MVSEELYIGSPIQSVLRPTAASIAYGFSFLDYQEIVIYLYTADTKIVKMSTLERDGYLPLEIVSASEIKIFVDGTVTKNMGRGEIKFELFLDSEIQSDDLLGGTPFGICLVDNKIRREI